MWNHRTDSSLNSIIMVFFSFHFIQIEKQFSKVISSFTGSFLLKFQQNDTVFEVYSARKKKENQIPYSDSLEFQSMVFYYPMSTQADIDIFQMWQDTVVFFPLFLLDHWSDLWAKRKTIFIHTILILHELQSILHANFSHKIHSRHQNQTQCESEN